MLISLFSPCGDIFTVLITDICNIWGGEIFSSSNLIIMSLKRVGYCKMKFTDIQGSGKVILSPGPELSCLEWDSWS